MSTSIHFFDHTAHFYIRSICDDLGMNYIDFLPAHMHDLLDDKQRPSLDALFDRWIRQAQLNFTVPRAYPAEPVATTEAEVSGFSYRPGSAVQPLTSEKKVCIVVDDGWAGPETRAREDGGWAGQNLRAMVNRMTGHFPQAEIVDLCTIKMGPCLGCLKCGPLQCNPHMREVLQAYTENMRANLVDIITDEGSAADRSQCIDARLDFLARTLVEYAERNVMKPISFLGVGGMKIFRDEIFEQLKFVFQADHKYYRKHGMYDFPQKKPIKRIVFVPLMLLSKIPFVRKRIREKLKTWLTMPYRKVLQRHLGKRRKIR